MKWDTEKKAKVYLGIPGHDGRINPGVILNAGSSLGNTQIERGGGLPLAFNKIYANALTNRKNGVTHFGLLHDDVIPVEGGWLDKMVEMMKGVKADVLSVVLPIKDDRGLTSTGIEIEDKGSVIGFRDRKLTLKECVERGVVWTDGMLLINTGMMLVDMSWSGAEKVWFEFKDGIHEKDGVWYASCISEDYGFSRKVRGLGGRMYVTSGIKAEHIGGGRWKNYE